MSMSPEEVNPFDEILLAGEDVAPWDDVPGKQKENKNEESQATASSLFPSLNSGGEKGDTLPPPTPERDTQGYDRNNWSRLLRQARDMRPEIAEYLEVLYNTGLGLELKKVRVKAAAGSPMEKKGRSGEGGFVEIEKFVFTRGSNENWDERRIQEVLSSLYTYMMLLPARKELGHGGEGGNQVVAAMEAAIKAGGLLAVGPSGLKFDWSRARDQGAVDRAKGLMDGVGKEIMGYVRMAERGLREIGFVVGLAEFCDGVE